MNKNTGISNNGGHPVTPDSSRALNTLLEERPTTTFAEPSSGYGQDMDDESFDWRRLLSVAKRRKKIIGATMLAVLALAGVRLALSPNIYKASTDLLINTQNSSTNPLGDSLPALGALMGATGTRSQDTEVEIMRSSTVQDAADSLMPKSFQSAADRSKMVQVDIEPKRSTDIITVNVQSRDPKMAIAYSNALCEAYSLQDQKNNTSQYKETANYIGGELEKVRKNLDNKRDELRKFKEANHLVDLPAESQARVARLAELQSALQEAEADSASGAATLKNLRDQANKMSSAETMPSTIIVRPIVQQLRTQLTDLEAKRLDLLQEFVPGASEVTTVDDQITALRNRLKTEATTEVGTYTRNINPVRQAILEDISKTQSGVWSAQARADALRGNIVTARQSVEKLPQREYQLSQLQGDLATYQETFQSLSDKYQTLLISQKTPVSNSRIITPAKRAIKVSPRVASTLMLALLGGLLLSLALAAAVDSMDNKIYTEEDAVQATGLPVLTHVPALKLSKGEPTLIGKGDESFLLESFRMLRTQISFIGSYGQLKTLVLTSSQPNEGKSTVSANLAISLALNKKKVVLVDTDLRRPTIHQTFNMGNGKGFTSVVAGECLLEEALQATDIEGLYILSSGPKPPNPAELLDSRVSRDLIESLKQEFDYVIIDAPPALMIADAQIVASMADGVLLVVSCQEANRNAVERTYELMVQAGIRVIGMVLNKFTQEQGSYYGYYGAYNEAPKELR